jgi:ribonuclease HI
MDEFLNINRSDKVIELFVYTDGACIHNGKPNAKAGMGVFFGYDDSRNISKKVEGKQTNNTAELGAVYEALCMITQEIKNNLNICIVTDSEYVIKCCTTYGKKCKLDNWKKDIPNKELVKTLFTAFDSYSNLSLMHIDAHTGKQDKHSLGNEEADRLANLAIGQTSCPYQKTETKAKKCYLKVKYEDKDEAKSYGAKWDPSKKKWYYMSDLNSDKINLLQKFS